MTIKRFLVLILNYCVLFRQNYAEVMNFIGLKDSRIFVKNQKLKIVQKFIGLALINLCLLIYKKATVTKFACLFTWKIIFLLRSVSVYSLMI